MRTVRSVARLGGAEPIQVRMLDESPTLDKNSKKLESFVQISMQLAGDGTKPKSGGWGYGGVWLVGF